MQQAENRWQCSGRHITAGMAQAGREVAAGKNAEIWHPGRNLNGAVGRQVTVPAGERSRQKPRHL